MILEIVPAEYEWTLVTRHGDATFQLAGKELAMKATDGYGAYVFTEIHIPQSRNCTLTAMVFKMPWKHMDCRIGFDGIWGRWTGRNTHAVARCAVKNVNKSPILMLGSGGEHGEHFCLFSKITLEYEPMTDPGPQPGIPGLIAESIARINRELAIIRDLLPQWEQAQRWVDTYNKNKVGE